MLGSDRDYGRGDAANTGRGIAVGPAHPGRVDAWRRRQIAASSHEQRGCQQIFALRLAGESVAGIACTLNHLGVPSPSAHDQARNPHRAGDVWNQRTVAVILANPRYTGRQVWDRQGIGHNETIPGDKRTSHGPVHRWNPKTDWIISNHRAHPLAFRS